MGKNFFEVLGVTQNIEQEPLDGAARRLLAKYHPDQPGTGNVERFLVIDKAYKAIKIPQERLKWIRRLALAEKLTKQAPKLPDSDTLYHQVTPINLQRASGSSWASMPTNQPISGVSIGHNVNSFIGKTSIPGTVLTDSRGYVLRLESWRVILLPQSCEYEVVIEFEGALNRDALGSDTYWRSLFRLESTQSLVSINQIVVDGLRFFIKVSDSTIFVNMNTRPPPGGFTPYYRP